MEIMGSWIESLKLESVLDGLESLTCFTGKDVLIFAVATSTVYFLFIRKLSIPKKEDYKSRPRMKVDAPYHGEEMEFPDYRGIPVISGWFQCKVVRFLSNTFFKTFYLNNKLIKKMKQDALETIIYPEIPTFYPLIRADAGLYDKEGITDNALWSLSKRVVHTDTSQGFRFVSMSDLLFQYREGTKTTESVMRTLFKSLKESENQSPPLRCYIEYYEDRIMEQAVESTKRWKEGKPLSVFDGIPVGIKDEYHVDGHHVRTGLPFVLNNEKFDISDEKGLVKLLREGGAIIIGITNMNQLGAGVTGINQSKLHGAARNPYNVNFPPGGSSSGSASAVASGLCVVSLGSDGGGSIRIPAAYCGIVGLKGTYGAYSLAGKESGTSVTHAGALCSSVRDMAITHGFLSGKDGNSPAGSIQPPLHLGDFDRLDLSGLKVGVDRAFLKNALPEIEAAFEDALKWLEEIYHVEIVTIHIPEKGEIAMAHRSIIMSEIASKSKSVSPDKLNIYTLNFMESAKKMDAHNYLQAAKQRTRAINALKYIFSEVDVVLSPAFNMFQPKITQGMEKYGHLDVAFTSNTVQLHSLMNLTGVPAMTLPVGYSKENLPLAVQLFSSWWREDIIFKVAYAIEQCVRRKKPQVYFDITE